MNDQSYDDSQSICSYELSDSESLLDFFSGEPVRSAQEEEAEDALEAPCKLYQPLEEHEIRVIVLDPATKFDDPVHCRFNTTSIRWPIPYSALSYAWGELQEDGSHFTHTICCDGLPLKVTRTLYQALLRIRHSQDTAITALWIDAICINQSDPVERAAQVMIMDKVYGHASHLLIWLGDHIMPFRFLFERDLRDSDQATRDKPFGDVGMYGAEFKDAPWFTRRWVIQEAMCCRNPQSILAGLMQFAVTNLANVLIDPTKTLTSGTVQSSEVRQQRTLFENLVTFDRALCSDDRDRIYALRNISEDGNFVPVDYSHNAKELYTSLARQWTTAGFETQVLIAAVGSTGTGRRHRSQPLPSWVPDWGHEVGRPHKLSIKALDPPSLTKLSRGVTNPGSTYVTKDLWLCLRVPGWVVPLGSRKVPEQPSGSTYQYQESSAGENWSTKIHEGFGLYGRQVSFTGLYTMKTGLYMAGQFVKDKEFVHHDAADAVLLTQTGDSFSLRSMDGRRSERGQDEGIKVWALAGTHKRNSLTRRTGLWYCYDSVCLSLLPDLQQVHLV